VLPGLVKSLGGVADFLFGLDEGVSRTAKRLIRVDERSSVPVHHVAAAILGDCRGERPV
jgi:hypothetical protein